MGYVRQKSTMASSRNELVDILYNMLKSTLVAKKQLSNGLVEWFKIESNPYTLICTRWLDGSTHIEYRNLANPDDYKVIYTDLTNDKKDVILKTIRDLNPELA